MAFPARCALTSGGRRYRCLTVSDRCPGARRSIDYRKFNRSRERPTGWRHCAVSVWGNAVNSPNPPNSPLPRGSASTFRVRRRAHLSRIPTVWSAACSITGRGPQWTQTFASGALAPPERPIRLCTQGHTHTQQLQLQTRIPYATDTFEHDGG